MSAVMGRDEFERHMMALEAQQRQAQTDSYVFATLNADAHQTPDFDRITKQNNIRYGRSYMTFDDLISKFDVSRLPDIDGATMPLVGHVIFSRPSIHVNAGVTNHSDPDPEGRGSKNFGQMKSLPMTAAFVSDRYGRYLLNRLSYFSETPYMPLFTTRAMNYSVNDIGLKTVEKGQTYFGHVLKYGKHSEEHKAGGTISLDFRNDRYQSILKSCYIWMAYIWYVSKNDAIEPYEIYQKNGIIDYAGSIYYLVTQMDMSRLVYWEKLTGVFPKTVPMSMFSYNDAPIVEDKITVEFDYGIRSDPCDPDVLLDLNTLSAGTQSGGRSRLGYPDLSKYGKRGGVVRPDSFERPFGLGNAFATKPFIRAEVTNGTLAYFLQWFNS